MSMNNVITPAMLALLGEAGLQEIGAEQLHYSIDFEDWPFKLIDWEEAASDLCADMTVVTFDGIEYFYQG